MKISLLVPCYNEEKSVRKSAQSWLSQSRPADEIIVVDDCSSDATPEILKEFEGRITVVRPYKNTGNKSSAQEYGLQFVTGDVFVATDGDTLLDKDFIKLIEKDFEDPDVKAVGGYVKSLKYNWLTACRALDYAIGQNIDKLAQDYVNYMLVIPGAAGAFRTDVFRTLGFDHDTLTEDLDFTYKLHKMGHRIKYNRMAICYTQDPPNLTSYINQMRRWFGGGWQNFMKHFSFPKHPGMALELSLIYGEGLVFSMLLFLIPLVNIFFAFMLLGMNFLIVLALALFGVLKENRWDFLLVLPQYIFLKYVNALVYLEQFFKEVIFKKKNMVWFKPERVKI
jgi:cellulose synthase/poly-beta-1,6-N-acetylglucosamine synthase-like glycosyltransferase